MRIVKPPHLEKGQTIGIVSPASPLGSEQQLRRGVRALEALGYRVEPGKNVLLRRGHMAGTPEERADDLNRMLRNPDIRAVMAARGGYNSNATLELLDYDAIRHDPKIITGYSDITALANGIHAQTGLVTFSGPLAYTTFGEYPQPQAFTVEWMQRLLSEIVAPMELRPAGSYTSDRLGGEEREREMRPAPPWRGLKPGKATGRLAGGNLATLLAISGTPYYPDFKGKILFIEDDEAENPGRLDRMLTHLRLQGIYAQISGLLIGRFPWQLEFPDDYPFDQIVLTATRGYDFPIMSDLDFGHTDPMFTLPIGVQATMDATHLTLTLDEAAVI